MKAPNGWISHDLFIWNELDRRGFVSKGFVLEIPDLRHGSDRALDSFYESVRQFLHTLEESHPRAIPLVRGFRLSGGIAGLQQDHRRTLRA